MSEPFSLSQIKFASLQFRRLLCNPSLGTPAVFDIGARSEPFHDVSLFITKRQLPVEERSVRSVGTPDTGFYFERFTARQSGVPFLNYRSYIIRMDRFGPAPKSNQPRLK
jgi:hypothetical protein